MTARRKPADARSLPLAEWERLMREKTYPRPLPPPTPLHLMGRDRRDAAERHNAATEEP
jgi:hypothetical protein